MFPQGCNIAPSRASYKPVAVTTASKVNRWTQFAGTRTKGITQAAPAEPTSTAPVSPVPASIKPTAEKLELTEENVEKVLDEVRPYLIADGGNVEFVEIDGRTVRLRLVGACSSCPSSTTTMALGIQKKLVDSIPDVMDVEEVKDEVKGLDLTEENVEKVLDEIRPYLVSSGGGVYFDSFDGTIVRIKLTGPAVGVAAVRSAITGKLRDSMPKIMAVQILS